MKHHPLSRHHLLLRSPMNLQSSCHWMSLSTYKRVRRNTYDTYQNANVEGRDISPKKRRRLREEEQSDEEETHNNKSRFTSEFDSILELGSGTFGTVFKARHKIEEKDYAVKVIAVCDEKSLREVQALSKLEHSHIVRYHTCWIENRAYPAASPRFNRGLFFGSDGEHLYIQMELCSPKTLRQWIDQKLHQTLTNLERGEESLNIYRQICSGVEYIHSKGHIHRDLKPENIFFGYSGEVKIGDFGLVTLDDYPFRRSRDRGTKLYMAPEQRGEHVYDHKVDIFALGLVYFELLWKIQHKDRILVFEEVRHKTYPRGFVLDFPEEMEIIKSMLCRDPESRPEATTVRAKLENLAEKYNKLRRGTEAPEEEEDELDLK